MILVRRAGRSSAGGFPASRSGERHSARRTTPPPATNEPAWTGARLSCRAGRAALSFPPADTGRGFLSERQGDVAFSRSAAQRRGFPIKRPTSSVGEAAGVSPARGCLRGSDATGGPPSARGPKARAFPVFLPPVVQSHGMTRGDDVATRRGVIAGTTSHLQGTRSRTRGANVKLPRQTEIIPIVMSDVRKRKVNCGIGGRVLHHLVGSHTQQGVYSRTRNRPLVYLGGGTGGREESVVRGPRGRVKRRGRAERGGGRGLVLNHFSVGREVDDAIRRDERSAIKERHANAGF